MIDPLYTLEGGVRRARPQAAPVRMGVPRDDEGHVLRTGQSLCPTCRRRVRELDRHNSLVHRTEKEQ